MRHLEHRLLKSFFCPSFYLKGLLYIAATCRRDNTGLIKGLPGSEMYGSVREDTEGEMGRVKIMSKVSMFDIVNIRFPDELMMMEGIKEGFLEMIQPHGHSIIVIDIPRRCQRPSLIPYYIADPGVEPFEIQQELNLVAL